MVDDDGKFRLVTRSDFDGVVCAALFKELDVVNHVEFAHPKDIQDGKILLGPDDITANLPFDSRVQRAFDHHLSENLRLEQMPPNYVNEPTAPSAARVVYDFYGGEDAFPEFPTDLMAAVDRADSGQFTREEVLKPDGWAMLNFLMDARTGFGRFRDFRVSNYQIMHYLIDCIRALPADEILKLPDIAERTDFYDAHRENFEAQIQRCTKVFGNLLVLDLRDEDPIYCGNRFMLYALYPDANISIHVIWGLKKQNTVFAIGKSIFNRTSNTNIGNLSLTYGGGGHESAGTCQVPNEDAEHVQKELIDKITGDG